MGLGKAVGWGLAGLLASVVVHGAALVVLVTVVASVAGCLHLRSHHRREFSRPQQRRRAR